MIIKEIHFQEILQSNQSKSGPPKVNVHVPNITTNYCCRKKMPLKPETIPFNKICK